MNYKNDDDFIVKLKVKQPNDELYIIKGNENKTADEIAKIIGTVQSENGRLGWNDNFSMPVVEMNVERNYNEVVGGRVVDGVLRDYTITVMIEKIKFKIDEVGAKVEN